MGGAVKELIKQLNQEPSRIWNGVELHKQYEDFGEKVLSRCLLINYLRDMLHPDLFVLSSSGMVPIVMLRSKASTTFALWMILMMTATLKLCQALVAK